MFESFGKTWFEISEKEKWQLIRNNQIINKYEVSKIFEYLESKKIHFWKRPYGQDFTTEIQIKTKNCPLGRVSNISIELIDDGWYIVSEYNHQPTWNVWNYYKCDQLEGLMDFLREKI